MLSSTSIQELFNIYINSPLIIIPILFIHFSINKNTNFSHTGRQINTNKAKQLKFHINTQLKNAVHLKSKPKPAVQTLIAFTESDRKPTESRLLEGASFQITSGTFSTHPSAISGSSSHPG